jgi:hypothetical protein
MMGTRIVPQSLSAQKRRRQQRPQRAGGGAEGPNPNRPLVLARAGRTQDAEDRALLGTLGVRLTHSPYLKGSLTPPLECPTIPHEWARFSRVALMLEAPESGHSNSVPEIARGVLR